MGRRKIGQEHIRNIQKSNGSYLVSIPIELIRELGWVERQRVVITRSGAGKLVIKDYTDA
jgi:bifunctional DNA-binding transcriptional regulator/antitoxin component of YhaV-PrlF toxin-antitoxin module